ncbi:MAG: hypothetical protein RR486_12595, partial [Clostridium sp.]|uniref:hypothetical protein n=2 Tax=Clostridium sp. TaxID=1506 RepID=UPI003050D8CA
EGRFDNFEGRFDNFEGRFDNLENKVDKNTILLEKLDSNIKLVAEVQQGFQEQLGRNLHTDGKTIADRLELIELAVTNGSDNLNDLADNLDVVKNTVGIHEMDLRMMKNKKKHTF